MWRLLSAPVVPLDFRGNVQALASEVGLLATKLAGRLDLGSAVLRCEFLVQAVQDLAQRAAQAQGSDATACTRALVEVSRALVPLECTSGDRFDPDPALPLPRFPVLPPIRDLASSAPDDGSALFLAVAARRARNRVGAALDAAMAACAIPGFSIPPLTSQSLKRNIRLPGLLFVSQTLTDRNNLAL